MEFLHHPDGFIRVVGAAGTYVDTVENFAADHGAAVVALPAGVRGRLYEPGKRHALFTQDGQTGGPLPWPEGDAYIAAVGDLLAARDARLAPPPPTLDQVKKARKAQVDARLLDIGENGVPYGGKLLQLRPEDQPNITAMSQAAMLAQSGVIPWPADFAWRMRDNSYLPMPTPADMIALAAFAMQTVKTLRFKAFAHKDAIDAAETAAEVEAHDIEQGW